jgi:hypothetical protein
MRRLFGCLSPGLPTAQDIDQVTGFPKPVCHPSGIAGPTTSVDILLQKAETIAILFRWIGQARLHRGRRAGFSQPEAREMGNFLFESAVTH